MKYKRWMAFFFGSIIIICGLSASITYWIDPCFLFRTPTSGEAVFFEERQQNAGLIRQIPADTIVLGTSMARGYLPSQIVQVYGGAGLKLSFPDGYLSEFDLAMDGIDRYQDPKRIIFLLDPNILVRDEMGKTNAMPEYLYNGDPLAVAKYLLNKDILYRSVYVAGFAPEKKYQSMDEAFSLDTVIKWSKALALLAYERPDVVASPPDMTQEYVANAMKNAQAVLHWAQAHPERDYVVAFPPYSILQWDAYQREGTTQAVLTAVGETMDLLLKQENISVHFLTGDTQTITDLTQYGDHVHHSGQVAGEMLEALKNGTYEVHIDTYHQVLRDFYAFVSGYDYDTIWLD